MEIQSARPRVLRTIEIWRTRPNRERRGIDDPLAVMRKAGRALDITAA